MYNMRKIYLLCRNIQIWGIFMNKYNEFKENDLADEAKKGKRLFIIAIICFLISFGFILWAAIVQDKNVKNSDIIGIVGKLKKEKDYL